MNIVNERTERIRGRTLLINSGVEEGTTWAALDGSNSVVKVDRVSLGQVTYICVLDGDVMQRPASEFVARYGKVV